MLVQGMITGAVGITFAHELMHQKTKLERFFSDILMAMAFYGHFRTEHVFVHHRYVGTKKDAVTARFNESFYTFFLRVIPQCLISAWSVEAQKLASKNKSILNISNPFYIYAALACFFVFLSFVVGGAWGIALFFIQALVAVLHLEVVNYIEHYGLSRKKYQIISMNPQGHTIAGMPIMQPATYYLLTYKNIRIIILGHHKHIQL